MNVRISKEQDADRILELLHQVNDVHAKGRPDLFIEGCTKYNHEELLQLLQDVSRPVYVCVDDSDYVLGYGFCVIEEIKDSSNQPDMKSIYIDDICVDEKYRGQHVGTAVYNHIVNEARRLGCYHITLNVWELNPTARKFYEAMGLTPLKTTMECVL